MKGFERAQRLAVLRGGRAARACSVYSDHARFFRAAISGAAKMLERFRPCGNRSRALRRLLADRAGTIAVTTGLMLTGLIGVTGLSIDMGNWYFTRRAMQSAADAAAIAGALEQAAGSANGQITTAAQNDATLNGFGPGNGTTVTVTPGNQVVSVTISRPAQLLLASMFMTQAPTIQVTAEAGLVDNGGPACLLALSPSASGALLLNGNAGIDANGCSIVVNSTSQSAINANGNATIDSERTCGPGGAQQNGNVHFNPTPDRCGALSDPLAGLAPPPNADDACQFNGLSLNGNVTRTLTPGVYCNGLTINGNANVTFQPGTYVMRGGTFVVNGNANLSGTGVGFYLSGTTVDLNGNGTVHLSAPTDGPMAGLIFSQDHATPADSITHTINGNGNVTYEGTFYFGRQDVILNGNGNANSTAPFTMVIADKMTFNGNGTMNFNSNFQDSNVPPPHGMNLNRVALKQ